MKFSVAGLKENIYQFIDISKILGGTVPKLHVKESSPYLLKAPKAINLLMYIVGFVFVGGAISSFFSVQNYGQLFVVSSRPLSCTVIFFVI